MRGFSLVELSIVLVILGLLTGGILAGQSLIRASELRAVSAEYSRYVTATLAFRDKYFALPGDFRDATRFWNFQSGTGCVSNHGLSVAGSPGTCDGDGDGKIEVGWQGSSSVENHQFWRQLALAGFIEGQFTGFVGSVNAWHAIIGENVPTSKISRGSWRPQYRETYGSSWHYTLDYGNYFDYGRVYGHSHFLDQLITPEEAWNIDTKMDDGKPAQGKIIAVFWNDACAAADDGSSANNDYAASYRLADKTAQCSLIFRQAF